MSQQWYLRNRGRTLGPLSEAEMHSMVRRRLLTRSFEASEDGQRWKPASELTWLFAAPAVAAAKPVGPTGDDVDLMPEPFEMRPAPAPQPIRDGAIPAAGGNGTGEAETFYYVDEGEQIGPMPLATIKSLVRNGTIDADTVVWKEGAPSAVPARQVPSLAVLFSGNPGRGTDLGYAPRGGRDEYIGYAGFWLRAVALMIDTFVLVAANVLLFFTVAVAADSASVTDEQAAALLLFLQVAYWVLSWLYFAFMESSPLQATLGKHVLGLRVTDLNQQPIGFGRATGRYFGKIVSGLIFGVGYVMAAFTERKQGLHDMMAATLVMMKAR